MTSRLHVFTAFVIFTGAFVSLAEVWRQHYAEGSYALCVCIFLMLVDVFWFRREL